MFVIILKIMECYGSYYTQIHVLAMLGVWNEKMTKFYPEHCVNSIDGEISQNINEIIIKNMQSRCIFIVYGYNILINNFI